MCTVQAQCDCYDPASHDAMDNDRPRTAAYAQALQRKVKAVRDSGKHACVLGE